MHRDFWQRQNFSFTNHTEPTGRNALNIDSDTALIIILILILKKEKGDPLLILALLYILT